MSDTKRKVWDKLAGKTEVQSAVEYMQNYINTYDQQQNFENYPVETFINDMLYGIGVAIDDKYKFGNGFEKFKEMLLEHINKNKEHIVRKV